MIKRLCGLVFAALGVLLLVGCGKCNDYYYLYSDVKVNSMRVAYVDSVGADTSKVTSVNQDKLGKGRLSLRLYGDVQFWVDIYGCETHGCSEATSIVAHNEDYTYERLILPKDFIISKFKGDVKAESEEQVYYLFRLIVDTDDIALSWDIQVWDHHETQCPTDTSPW
ncbi:MAG: hypothetical protein HUK19_07520 [Fibrobacter sp.]|nr:hypothetical protein [Fibrobacter sp.]